MNYLLPVISIASIYAFRMLGLFMILPVFATLAIKYENATPALIGTALGAYGLTQAILQMPLGVLSDQFGRKTIIVLGLSLFAIGSVIAALATDIHVVILGRALQGAGAIGSTLLALVADVTAPEKRNQAMAIIGASIGGSFALAVILGPLVSSGFGLSGIFWLTTGLACTAIFALFMIVPTPQSTTQQTTPTLNHFKTVLRNPELLQLNFGIFCQHAILTAAFVVIPKLLIDIPSHNQWKLYFAIMFIAFISLWKLKLFKRADSSTIFHSAIFLIVLSQLALFLFPASPILLAGLLLLFFFGFTILEIALPSRVSKTAPQKSRGTAMGVYSTCQFLGLFFGGTIAGFLHQHFGIKAIFAMTSTLSIGWLFLSYLPYSGIALLKQVNTIDD